MGYGTVVPDGYLPVFSVDTGEEAQQLIVAACPMDDGQYYARELAESQTLTNLQAFSDRLADIWFNRMKREPERYAKANPDPDIRGREPADVLELADG